MPFEPVGGSWEPSGSPKWSSCGPRGFDRGLGKHSSMFPHFGGDRKPSFHCVVLVVVRPGVSLDIVCCVVWGPGPKDQL